MFVVLGVSLPVFCQQSITRGTTLIAPLVPESNEGFFTSHSFLAEVGVGNSAEVQSQAWNGRFSLNFNIYSFTSNDHIVGTLSNELTGTRTNSVLFNPNTSRWEEFLGYRKRIGLHSFTLGYTHFCKHEIDNFDPPFSTPQTIDSMQKRIVIFGGITSSFFSQLMFSNTTTLQYYIKPHYNFVREDYRYTRGLEGVLLSRLRGNLEVGTRLNIPMNENFELYFKGWGNIGLIEANEMDQKFPTSEFLFNGRAEIGCIGKGVMNNFELFLATEYIADDLSFGAFTNGNVPSIGIRIRNPLFF